MKQFVLIFIVLGSFAALTACAAHDKKHAGGPTQIIYSPTGDPLNGGPLGRPTCPDAMKRWFERVDANHDGAITLDEFLNDAKIQFQRMDIDKNGYLVSEEVERFRMTYRDYPAESKEETTSPPKSHGKERGSSRENSSGATGSVIDPVMSADINLDYRVTPDEFLAYSQKTFKSLDTDHNGTLSQAEVAGLCGSKP